jgi:simple sugar transport system permease protein
MKLLLPSDRQLNFLLLVNITIVVLATAWSRGQFIGVDNLQSMASQVPELGLLAIGVMLTMISGNGGIDLSGTALANFAGVVAALSAPLLFSPDAAPGAYAVSFVAIALSVGTLGGLTNGLLIAKAGLTPILATLGTQLLFTGVAVVLTNGSTVRIGQVDALAAIGNENLLGVPIPFLLFLGAVLVLGMVLTQTSYGIRLYLMGTNPKAARYTGIPLPRMLVTTYAISGVLASLAGVAHGQREVGLRQLLPLDHDPHHGDGRCQAGRGLRPHLVRLLLRNGAAGSLQFLQFGRHLQLLQGLRLGCAAAAVPRVIGLRLQAMDASIAAPGQAHIDAVPSCVGDINRRGNSMRKYS